MNELDELAAAPLFGNAPLDWLIACAVAVGAFLALTVVRRFVRGYHKRLLATNRTEILEIPMGVLSRTATFFFIVLSLYAGSQTLIIGSRLATLFDSVITIALFWQAGIWAGAAASAWIDRKRRKSMEVDRAMVGSLGIISFMLSVLIWSLVVLLTLDNLGVDITALVAGLGIGGIAVALAIQNILGDLFASLSITLDRPFVVGDFLAVSDFLGSVEYIGIKSTRLRSLSGEQIVISNADLLGSRVRNYGRMAERRVVFMTKAPYKTAPEQVERIPKLIREAIEAEENTRFDRSHFQKYDAGALDFETVYYVLSADFNAYMDIQQRINLRIYREFVTMGVEFAYPTQRLFVEAAAKERAAEAEAASS